MGIEEQNNLRKDLSHPSMYGKLILNTDVVFEDEEVFGDTENHTLNFDVWDGFAYCYDYEGSEYFMTYPKKSLISMSNDMTKTIREHLSMDNDTIIEPIHILQTYNKLHKVIKNEVSN